MQLEPLPPSVDDLLRQLRASPRLVAHLTLVHDVACKLTERLDTDWGQMLVFDRTVVRMGAAVHDIGKTAIPDELTQPGHAHEAVGEALLLAHGFPEAIARIARTHRQWATVPVAEPEDLLVAAADTWWRGKRDDELEAALYRWIAAETPAPAWEAYAYLDEVATSMTANADARLSWQQQFAATQVDGQGSAL
jgi:putative nucleotidyltransferase with HDIG domain